MHRLTATPGGWNFENEGVIFVEQNPADIVIITAADTDIQTLAGAIDQLPDNFPTIRVVNLLQLQQQLSIDTYADQILVEAKVIILRLLGGRAYWSYGLEVVKEIVEQTNANLWIIPGDDRPDPNLVSHSNVSLAAVDRLWRYFGEGGVENFSNGLKFVSDLCFNTSYHPPQPQVVPKVGLYNWQKSSKDDCLEQNLSLAKRKNNRLLYKNFNSKIYSGDLQLSPVGIVFYRSHYLAGNTLPIDSLCEYLSQYNLLPIPVYISSLREEELHQEFIDYLQSKQAQSIKLLINTTSFSLAKIGQTDQLKLWQKLDVTILQVILSSNTLENWQASSFGLTPRDVAMNIALPEVDGRVITRAISFKSVKTWNNKLETDVIVYQPQLDRVKFIAELSANWVKLKTTPISEQKIAIILANYPNKDGRIANGVGLDTPSSCIKILQALKQAGYKIKNIPANGDQLIKLLTTSVTNDLENNSLRITYQSLALTEYQQYFASLPQQVQTAILNRWGKPESYLINQEENYSIKAKNNLSFPISGIQLGNIFIGIQPSRGYDLDPSLNYHAPDLEPTHHYLAYYYWLKNKFNTNAIIHLGKHGNLEWLPGKSIALSNSCYPEITLNTIPNFYPFIVNDPGEGSQAKRRAHAVIIDHLTPPMTRAELYGGLHKLEGLIDEYYQAQSLDPTRLPLISNRITELIKAEKLDQDLGIEAINSNSLRQFLTVADGYLCELKEAQIRDGLHIFGQCPQGSQLVDLIIAIARQPQGNLLGITQALAEDLDWSFDPLIFVKEGERGRRGEWEDKESISIRKLNQIIALFQLEKLNLDNLRNRGKAIEILEHLATAIVSQVISEEREIENSVFSENLSEYLPETNKVISWIGTTLLPALQKTSAEITNLLAGLNGNYVPSGAAGAPTRGRADVLPTGRNFYSVDIRGIPTETAWSVGSKAAEVLIERYTQENGEYPQNLAISIWGTSTMRTGGDDVAQVMALLGVRPIWDGVSRRVVDFEILSPAVLGRPRVDVTIRVSGFFRDAFPNILDLLYKAIAAVSSLKEAEKINPLAAQVRKETEFWQNQGLTKTQAKLKATHRIFGSKPGAYGAGLQGLIEAQNWQNDDDLARAYINWSSYAYGAEGKAFSEPEVFSKRLEKLQVILHNQDNREHDLLDSDDYYQFQGGLTAAVRSLTGKNPTIYFGDNSVPYNPKVRQLKEEINRVYRSRVVNPKWINSVMKHGYKGALEMAATVDYLFAYDATTKCVQDHLYQGITEAYLFDPKVQEFIANKNPWALRDMAERLIEAHQRSLWQSANSDTIEKLKTIVNHAEGIIENMH